MIQLFKTVQTKMIFFVPESTNRVIKKQIKSTEKKAVPQFLTREIILKLKKKKHLISDTSVSAFDKDKTRNNVQQKNKRVIEKITTYLDKYNKNVKNFKKCKYINGSIINIKETNIQITNTLFYRFCNSFLIIKPFFLVLQKFTNLLLKKNAYLVRKTYPFIYAGLKGKSTISGFKKVLYNKVVVQDRKLKPIYNRRKHNISHYMVIKNQFARLSKAFVYLGKNKLTSILSAVLKTAYPIPSSSNKVKNKQYNCNNSKLFIQAKAIPNLVSIIEGQKTLLLWRNQFNNSLTKVRQDYKQGISQNLNIFSNKSSIIIIKKCRNE